MDYDENPIQVFTQYSYEQMKAFRRFHYRRARMRDVILLGIFAVFFIIAVAGYFMYAPPGQRLNPSTIRYLILPFLVWGTILTFPLLLHSGVFYTRKAHANVTKLIQNGQRYSFCNHDFAVSTEQQDNMWQGRTAYTVISKVWETADMFYLYTGKTQAHLVDKRGFVTGDAEELCGLLLNHMHMKNYKKYKI